MATKKEIEITLKSSFDSKGVEEARKQIESLRNAGKPSSGQNTNTNADDQAKALEKEAQAEERRQKKAQEAADAIEQSRRREKAALNELVSELEKYQAALKKATQQENHPDRLKALKNIQELERRISALTRAQEREAQAAEKVARSSNQLDRNSQQATRSVKNMGQGLLQVAYFMDDVQYGIKGILNNIPGLVIGFGGGAGLAGAMSLAVLAGAKLYEWMGNTEAKSKELAKAIEQQNEAIAKSQEAIASFNNEETLQKSNDFTAKIAGNRKEEAQALKESVRDQQRLLDLQSKVLDNQDQADLLKLETDYYSGAFGDPENFSTRLFFEGKQEDIRLRARARHRREQEDSARMNVSIAESDLSSKTETTNRLSERLGGLEDQNILSYQEREKLNGEILNAEKQIFDNLLSIAKTTRNAAERTGNFKGFGRISETDIQDWVKQLIDNGGDTSALKNTFFQGVSAHNSSVFRTAPKFMEDVLALGNGRAQLDRLNALRAQRAASDNALVDAGYDVSTDDARAEAYKNRDKAVEEAKEALKNAIEDQTKAEESLTTSTQKLEEVRKINASEKIIDEAQRERNEALEQHKRIVQAQKEYENAIKAQIREKEDEVRDLKKEISRRKSGAKTQQERRDNVIENINLAGFSKSLTDALSSPDRAISGRARERKANINEAYGAVVRYIKDAFKDNKVTENEMEVLSKKLMQELSSRGENTTYKQMLDLIKRVVALVEKGTSNGKGDQAEIKSLESRVQRLEKEAQAQKKGLNMIGNWFVS